MHQDRIIEDILGGADIPLREFLIPSLSPLNQKHIELLTDLLGSDRFVLAQALLHKVLRSR